MTPAQSQRIQQLRDQVRAQLNDYSDAAIRRQFHPELSPLAWHVGHCFFTEAYWVQEVVCADNRHTAQWHPLYFPEYSQKTQRGVKLPERAALLAWTHEIEAHNRDYWQRAQTSGHSLMQRNYLVRFLIQHFAQHLETMAMVRQQMALAQEQSPRPAAIEPASPAQDFVDIPAGEAVIGNDDPACYDNELAPHTQTLAAYRIARRPVSNGQWLAFMQDGGYQRKELWDTAGQAWLRATRTSYPQHWREHTKGGWYCPDASENMAGVAPVHGICWHEARAYAYWANARLPHEYEWENAARDDLLPNSGQVWEWCDNALHPYPGFRAFPYDGYSTPWFDGYHRLARGGCRHTLAEIRRPTFRNFYPEAHRHVFAGLRLARNMA